MANLNLIALETVAVWLEAGAPHGPTFDMSPIIEVPPEANANAKAGNWCGTSCCIAGAAMLFMKPEVIIARLQGSDPAYDVDIAVWHEASQLLGLNPDEAGILFAPWNQEECDYRPYAEDITPERAAKTIRHLMATGEVSWTH